MSNYGSMSNDSYMYDDDAGRALFAACDEGNLEVIRELLKRDDVNVNYRDCCDEDTPLSVASRNG